MAIDIDNSSNTSDGVSRRTILKGAAWSAPVMIAAVAVPAAVASVNAITGVSKTSPADPLGQSQTLSVGLSVQPATFTGTVYLGLAPLDSQNFYFGSTGTATTTSVTFTDGSATVDIRTPAGNRKRATLSASSLANLSGAVTLTLTT